jgi:hypothetical protein
MNDIMIFSKILNDHLEHLRQIFKRLQDYNVILNSKKVFLEYFFIVLLEQIVNVLKLTTTKEKLTAIINLTFSLILKELKTYLNLTEYLRVYVIWYAQTSLFLQKRKTLLLKECSTKEKSRKNFFKNKLLERFIDVEIIFYKHLQQVFSDKKFLHHVNNIKRLFANVNIFKKRDIEAMIFHVKKNSEEEIAFNRFDIQSIMFLNKILTNAETRYWSAELKMIEVVWVIKKIRHLIELSRKQFIIIFIDHSTLTKIIKQTSLSTFNIDKLNLKLIRVSQYLSTLSIDIKMKSEKFHVISDALSRFFFITDNDKLRNFEENDAFEDLQYDLNVMIIQSINELKTFSFDVRSVYISDYLNVYFEQKECLIEMIDDYRKFLHDVYDSNSQWNKLKHKLEFRQDLENISDDIDFLLRRDLIYYFSKEKIFRLCISWSMKKNIYQMTHDDNHHCDFHRAYARTAESLYIRHMNKRLRRYIQHCKTCLERQITRH